jgi:hypothetical protein
MPKKKLKPRGVGKPFQKGEDPRRVHGRKEGQENAFNREIKDCLLRAGEKVGNRQAALANNKLPKRPSEKMPAELLEILKHNPEGMSSYFEWLAEEHPALYVALIGRALPQLMDSGQPAGAMQLVYRSAADIAKEFKERGLPPLQKIFQLPKRIDLNNPQTIDMTPEKQ